MGIVDLKKKRDQRKARFIKLFRNVTVPITFRAFKAASKKQRYQWFVYRQVFFKTFKPTLVIEPEIASNPILQKKLAKIYYNLNRKFVRQRLKLFLWARRNPQGSIKYKNQLAPNQPVLRQARKPILKLTSGTAVKKLAPSSTTKIDGIYKSVWLEKFAGGYVKHGKKKMAFKFVYQALQQLKFIYNESPILIFAEVLEKIKPIFRMRQYIKKRSKRKKQIQPIFYPTLSPFNYSYNMAITALKAEVAKIYAAKEVGKDLKRKITKPLNTKLREAIFLCLLEYKESSVKDNKFVRIRDNIMKDAIKNQHNLRFTWKSRNK